MGKIYTLSQKEINRIMKIGKEVHFKAEREYRNLLKEYEKVGSVCGICTLNLPGSSYEYVQYQAQWHRNAAFSEWMCLFTGIRELEDDRAAYGNVFDIQGKNYPIESGKYVLSQMRMFGIQRIIPGVRHSLSYFNTERHAERKRIWDEYISETAEFFILQRIKRGVDAELEAAKELLSK